MAKRRMTRISTRPVKDEVVMVKMSSDEKDKIIQYATVAGMSMSEWMRFKSLQPPVKNKA